LDLSIFIITHSAKNNHGDSAVLRAHPEKMQLSKFKNATVIHSDHHQSDAEINYFSLFLFHSQFLRKIVFQKLFNGLFQTARFCFLVVEVDGDALSVHQIFEKVVFHHVVREMSL